MEGIQANHLILSKRVAESVTLVTALNPIIGYEKAAKIAKSALATGNTIAATAEQLGIMSSAEMTALLVPENLTQPIRLVTLTVEKAGEALVEVRPVVNLSSRS